MSLSDSDKANLERIALERKRREGLVEREPSPTAPTATPKPNGKARFGRGRRA
jgi:hypothetical protein